MKRNIPPALVAEFDQRYAVAVADLNELVSLVAEMVDDEGLMIASSRMAVHVDHMPPGSARSWLSLCLTELAKHKLAERGAA